MESLVAAAIMYFTKKTPERAQFDHFLVKSADIVNWSDEDLSMCYDGYLNMRKYIDPNIFEAPMKHYKSKFYYKTVQSTNHYKSKALRSHLN